MPSALLFLRLSFLRGIGAAVSLSTLSSTTSLSSSAPSAHQSNQSTPTSTLPVRPTTEALIPRPLEFARKKAKFISDGPSKLQVVADFDYTLTKFWLDGMRASSCHATIENCNLLPEAYHVEAQRLQHTYYPLEVDPSIGLEQKYKYMEEWVTLAHEALIKWGLMKSHLPMAVQNSRLKVRLGVQELLDLTQAQGIPLLIFSAGIADVIEEVFRQQSRGGLPSHAHVISNRMIFDQKNGRLIGFEEPVFHVLNKRASAVPNSSYFHETDFDLRKNVVLVGDSLGDLHMSDGLQAEDILRIGFLNDRVAERMEEYKEKFDVVLLGDADIRFVVDLIRDIANGGSSSSRSRWTMKKQQGR